VRALGSVRAKAKCYMTENDTVMLDIPSRFVHADEKGFLTIDIPSEGTLRGGGSSCILEEEEEGGPTQGTLRSSLGRVFSPCAGPDDREFAAPAGEALEK
jgi:hypothetical protein